MQRDEKQPGTQEETWAQNNKVAHLQLPHVVLKQWNTNQFRKSAFRDVIKGTELTLWTSCSFLPLKHYF